MNSATRRCHLPASHPTPAMEDYLVAILTALADGRKVRGRSLAVSLKITHASVTGMLGRLRAAGWITHHHYGEVSLTSTGRTLAENAARRRRAVESWLRGLGLDEATVQRDAHVIEHGLSQAACLALENRLLRDAAPSVSFSTNQCE